MKKIAMLVAAFVLLMSAAFVLPANATPNNKVEICHATGSESNPYVVIKVDEHAVDVENTDHTHHDGDIIPATPECRGVVSTPTATVTETSTVTATATATETATATATATVTETAEASPAATVTVTETVTNDQTIPVRMTETVTATVTLDPSGSPVATSGPVDDKLAQTGSPIGLMLILGLSLIAAGIMARRLTRAGTH